MKFVLYTIGCPQCNVLEKKLNNAGVQYEIINDEKFFQENNMTLFPILEVDGIRYSLGQANKWIKENFT